MGGINRLFFLFLFLPLLLLLTSPAVDALSDDPNVRGRVASTLAGAAVLLTGGDVDEVQLAAQIGNTTRMYNRELHADERKILAGLTKNMSPQERRDTEDAALFLTQGHKGISNSNPRKQEIAARVAHGALQTDKIHLLKTAAPEKFDYSFQDRMLDQAAAYNEELGRLIGGAKVATGVAGMSASAAAVATVNAPTPLAVTSPLVTPLATVGFVGSAALVAGGQSELTANYSTVDQAQGVLDALKPGYQGSARQRVLDARAGQAMELRTEAILPAAGAVARGLRQMAKPLARAVSAGTPSVSTAAPLTRQATEVIGQALSRKTVPTTLGREQVETIVSMPKGQRPDPSTYMSRKDIAAHLKKFEGGVSKIKSTAPSGIEGPPGGTFVMPKSQADEIISQSKGSVRRLEKLLGLERGSLGSSPVRMDVEKPSGLRMSSGNEIGANKKWMPGGKTPGNISEATIDPVPRENYRVDSIFKTGKETP